MKYKVVQYGLGPIGVSCVKAMLKKPSFEIVGAIDIDPEKAGRDLNEVAGLPGKSGIIVSANAEKVLVPGKADIVVHTTSSFIKKIYDQFELAVKTGHNVISSTEELLVPELQNPEETEKLDKLARENNVTVLGTGVNPGFCMDTLPLFLSSMCLKVNTMKMFRVVDAGTRRMPLQKKVGAGLTVEEFKDLVRQKKLGHIGLIESLELVRKGLGWELDEVIETLDPMVADDDYKTDYFEVKKGQAAGIKHIARGMKDGKELLLLDLRMYVGAKDPHDLVDIDGNPPLKVRAEGGVAGDVATISSLVNNVPRVVNAHAGIKRMYEIVLPKAFE